MTIVGELSLWIAFLMAAWCSMASFAGSITGRRELMVSGERAAFATFGFIALAALGVWRALLRRDFSYAYVAGHVTANMPDAYVLAAFWAGSTGVMLLWALLLALGTVVAVRTAGRSLPAVTPFATAVLGASMALVIGVIAFDSNPFDRMMLVPADGDGMKPELQNPGMLLHPPLLTAGLALTAVPFALSLGALRNSAVSREWIAVMRRWCVTSWLLLSAGILLGMWWAYVEPGWGGYWNWDSVRSATLLPWLACTAALCFLVVLERHMFFVKWMLIPSMLPFILAVFAAIVSRGSPMDSTHAFARTSAAAGFSAFLIAASAVTALLLATRAERRPVGKYIARAAVIILLVAFTGKAFSRTHEVSLTAGQTYDVRDPFGRQWRFTSQGISRSQYRNSEVLSLTLEMHRAGRSLGLVTTEKRQYVDSEGRPIFDPSTEAGIRTDARLDTYVVLGSVDDDIVEVRITFNPLVVWVWVGGAMLIVGGVIAMWPKAAEIR